MSVPFLGRTLLPGKQQETMNNVMTALLYSLWKLTSLCTVDAPLLSSTHLDLLGWPLQGFPHVLNVIREPLLGPLHSHTLYYTPTNRSDCILLRLSRLLLGDTGSPQSKGNNAGYICHGKQGEWVFWAYLGYWGNSGSERVQDPAQEQLVRETAYYTECQRYSHLAWGRLPSKALGHCIIKSEAN
jgi:hypothetical protein